MGEFEYETQAKYTQQSEYKKSDIIINLCYGIFMILFSLFLLIVIIRKIILEWEIIEFNKVSLWLPLLLIVIFFFQGYLFFRLALVSLTYYKLNQKEEIQIDTENKLILILDKIKKTRKEIDFATVKSVELYYRWDFVGVYGLGYTKLILENNSKPIIITEQNIAQYDFYKIFKGKKIKTFNKFFHKLDN